MRQDLNLCRRILCSILALSLATLPSMRAAAEDIDLFVGGQSTADNPNVLVILDNSANWDAASQHWVGGKQGEAELRSLRTIAGELTTNINFGLMMFTPGQGQDKDGAYMRFAMRTMNATNKAALQELIGTSTCVDGANSLNGSPNCILKNFSAPAEKVGTAKTDYSAGMFEAFKYFGGYTSPAHAHDNVAGTPIVTSVPSDKFGPYRYAGSPDGKDDPAAFTPTNQRTTYNPPISATNACAKNYIIFIGNGFPVQDSASTLLTGVGGDATQLSMPQFTTVTTTPTTSLGTDTFCESSAACVTRATAIGGQDSYSCTGGSTAGGVTTVLGTDNICESAAACVTRATTFGGQQSYSCTGGISNASQSAGSSCLTNAQCVSNAQIAFPASSGYASWTCTGGSGGGGSTVTLGTDTVCETNAQCAARAATPAVAGSNVAPFSCTGGSTTAGTPTTLQASTGNVCETPANCALRMQGLFPGLTNYACSGGNTNPPSCTGQNRINQVATANTGACTGSNLLNQTMRGTTPGCAAGTLSGQTMNAFPAATCASPNLYGQTMQGVSGACAAPNLVNQAMQGTKTLITVTPTGTSATPPNNEIRYPDEWAKYLYTTDVNAASGQQNVTTYTIDVFKDAQDSRQTSLLFSMAKYGGGKYFQATSEQAILDALRQILIEIQSTNSVFASASLPINATNRTQNENQVFIGMFRPDGTARPRWYGNLKRYQIARINGEIKLADADLRDALSTTTGFVQPCARSFWTTDSGTYWSFSPDSAGTCTTATTNVFSDSPDGPAVEKGATAEIVRRGNNPPTTDTTPTYTVSRNLYTCSDVSGTVTCTTGATMHTFNTTNVDQAAVIGANSTDHAQIINFTRGVDVLDDNANSNFADTRPGVHGDIVHSRPLPVNYGGTTGVVMYYGANDGTYRAVQASDGKELWAFIAPEHHSKLKRLRDNSPQILYPTMTAPFPSPMPTKKEYFFDGSTGLFQTLNSTQVWIYPSQRRGGRMLYGFDVTTPTTPLMKWRAGCPNLSDDTGCTTGLTNIGQTWSTPSVALVKGFHATTPVVISGGGYDACDDVDSGTTTCSSPKGSNVYVLNGDTGAILKTFGTGGTGSILRSVPSDIALIDRDFDGYVDHGYFADTGGNLYRIDFVDPVTLAQRAPAAWTVTRIAYTTGSGRKFLFSPGLLGTTGKVLVTITSGDRERPLSTNYPYVESIQNRAYMFIDKLQGTPINLDDPTLMDNFTTNTTCVSALGANSNGWFFDFVNGRGEQGVTSTTIFGGLVLFSTNMPDVTNTNACTNNLGKAFGYAVNVLNASGAIGTQALCGGTRSNEFIGGGLPPSPVTGRVPVDGKMEDVVIGGANREGSSSLTIGAQQIKPSITQKRQRVYWYRSGDK